ncbi:hypothetical protein [Actinophytocola sp.]|uniref:hypothetical protein n=1 Tax=Actinophytocola sp. TaxID=1872138 RepID=UPI002E195E24
MTIGVGAGEGSPQWLSATTRAGFGCRDSAECPAPIAKIAKAAAAVAIPAVAAVIFDVIDMAVALPVSARFAGDLLRHRQPIAAHRQVRLNQAFRGE